MRHALMRSVVWIVGLVSLVACGGGGGGGGGGDKSWLVFTPSPIVIETFQGEAGTQRLVATSHTAFHESFYVLYVLTPHFQTGTEGPSSESSFSWNLETSQDLAPATYTGKIEVRLCHDNPGICNDPVSGSPWLVDYTIKVNGPDLRALTPIAGVGPWTTVYGNPAHEPYVPATFDPAVFDRRWWFDPTEGYGPALSGIAVGSGRVFLRTGPDAWPTSIPYVLHAYRESDGAPLWTHSFGSTHFSDPALLGDRVYVVTNGAGAGAAELWTFDAATGDVVKHDGPPVPVGASYLTFAQEAPTPAANGILATYWAQTGAQEPRRIARFDADGEYVDSIAQVSSGSSRPVVQGGALLLPQYPSLAALNPATGATLWSAAVTSSAWWDEYANPVALSETLYCTADGRECVNTSTHAVATFSLPAGRTLLVAGNGVAYAGTARSALDTNLAHVEAYDIASGDLLWTWDSDQNLVGRPGALLTNGLLFLMRQSEVVALDLATQEISWSAPFPGTMAISEPGILYVSNWSTNRYAPRLMTWNLR